MPHFQSLEWKASAISREFPDTQRAARFCLSSVFFMRTHGIQNGTAVAWAKRKTGAGPLEVYTSRMVLILMRLIVVGMNPPSLDWWRSEPPVCCLEKVWGWRGWLVLLESICVSDIPSCILWQMCFPFTSIQSNYWCQSAVVVQYPTYICVPDHKRGHELVGSWVHGSIEPTEKGVRAFGTSSFRQWKSRIADLSPFLLLKQSHG